MTDEPSKGDIYSFETSPYTIFSAPKTNRHAAFKVLFVNESLIVVAALDRVWTRKPSLEDTDNTVVLREHRFGHSGRLAIYGMLKEWWNPHEFQNFIKLGNRRVTAEEQELASPIAQYAAGSRTGPFRAIDMIAEGEWRWVNDRAALESEIEKRQIKTVEDLKAKEERYNQRLKNLTWQQLLSETPFKNWSKSPPYPSIEFTKKARMKIHDLCRKLSKLGEKPKKEDVRRVVKECVEWFNIADEYEDGAIETEEREDICLALEEILFLAKQESLAEEIIQWRLW